MGHRGLPLVFLLALSPMAWGDDQAGGLPAADEAQRRPQRQDDKFISGAFQAQFQPGQIAAFGENPSLKKLVENMTPEQRQGAKAALAELEGKASTPEELEQVAEGYLLLKSTEDASRVAARMQEDNPKDSRGFRIGATAAFNQNDFPAATEQAEKALKLDPNDKRAFTTYMLSKGRSKADGPSNVPPDKPATQEVRRGSLGENSGGAAGSDAAIDRVEENLPLKPVICMGPTKEPPAIITAQPKANENRPAGNIPDGAVPLTSVGLIMALGGLAWRMKGRELAEEAAKEAWEQTKQTAAVGAIVLGTALTGYGGYMIYGAFTAMPALALVGGGTLAPAIAVEGAAMAEGAIVTVVGAKLGSDGYNYAKSQSKETGSSREVPRTQGEPSIENPESLRGADPEQVESLIPKGWVKGPMKKGPGTRYLNPKKPGESILVEKGWPGAGDPLHRGPYLRISRNGQIIRVPLKGNPAL